MTPEAAQAKAVVELAILADVLGLDLVSFQDHPYQARFLDARIDEAAERAGRRAADVRRMYNINGEFGSGGGFLQGPPAAWAEQLAALTSETGISSFILSVASDRELRVFAEEVAPAVRELVETERGREAVSAPAALGDPAAPSGGGPRATPFTVTPTPDDGTRPSDAEPWNEASCPSGPAPDPGRRYTRDQLAAGQHLVDVHDHLRAELTQLRDLIEQVARGTLDVGTARSFINQMTMRQNNSTLGAYCAQYCRVVTTHHTLEDQSVFPHLKRSDPELVPVIDRLEEEHHVIAHVLDQVDRALVAMVSEDDGMGKLRASVDLLTDTGAVVPTDDRFDRGEVPSRLALRRHSDARSSSFATACLHVELHADSPVGVAAEDDPVTFL